jgi:glycosyltransferase involved in cell wall biosynthesis
MTSLSVVVACRDRAWLLADCVRAVQADLRSGDELVVVDAGSVDGSVAEVATAAGATVLRSGAGSASAARDLGWRQSRHDLVAFTDDDCRPQPGWRDAVVAALEELDLVCCRVVPEGDGGLSVLDEPADRDYARSTDVRELGHGAGLGARRSALLSLDGWDVRLGPGTRWPGAEDKELQLRALAAGLRVGYRSAPVVRHLQWRSRRQVLSAEHRYGRGVAGLSRTGQGPSSWGWLRLAVSATLTDLRAGYAFGVLSGLARTAGIVRGALTRGALP